LVYNYKLSIQACPGTPSTKAVKHIKLVGLDLRNSGRGDAKAIDHNPRMKYEL